MWIPKKQDGVMITGMKIKYRAASLSFPEAGLTDAHADPLQTTDLTVAATTNHKVRWRQCCKSPFSQDAEG